MKHVHTFALLASVLGAAHATAQTPTATPAPTRASEEHLLTPPAEQQDAGGGGQILVPKDEPPTETIARGVRVGGPAPDHSRPSANAGGLKDLEAVSLRDGEARVRLNGVERTIRPGDTVAGDVVRRIEPTRLVFGRPEGDDREAIVIVTFDGQGRARVRVFSTADPTAGATGR